MAAAIEGTAGVVDLEGRAAGLVPQIEVRFRAERAEPLGVTPAAVRDAVATLVQGAKLGEVHRDQKSFDVFVWGDAGARSDLAALRRLPIDAPGGAQSAARRAWPTSRSSRRPTRSSARRRPGGSTSPATSRGATSAASRGRSRARSSELPFAPGYHPEFLGEYRAREAARTRLLALSGLAVLGIFLLLHADLGSLRLAALVVRVPSLRAGRRRAGGGAAGGVLSLGSLVGFVTVLGIAARNGIMLVSHYRHLEQREGVPFGPELVLRGAEERLVPILMTALCAALALLPLALAGDVPGTRSSTRWRS